MEQAILPSRGYPKKGLQRMVILCTAFTSQHMKKKSVQKSRLHDTYSNQAHHHAKTSIFKKDQRATHTVLYPTIRDAERIAAVVTDFTTNSVTGQNS
jgi:tryptophanase